MIKTIGRYTLAALFGVISALPLHAADKFVLDNQNSYVLWEIEHLGFSKQVGKWYVDGFVLLDKDHPDQSKVEATVKIADIITGLPELDKHLKSKSFFMHKRSLTQPLLVIKWMSLMILQLKLQAC
jgi:polyisoprenoid-binding protein YceI